MSMIDPTPDAIRQVAEVAEQLRDESQWAYGRRMQSGRQIRLRAADMLDAYATLVEQADRDAARWRALKALIDRELSDFQTHPMCRNGIRLVQAEMMRLTADKAEEPVRQALAEGGQ